MSAEDRYYCTLYFIVINNTKHDEIIFVFLYYERYSTSFIESGGDAHDLPPIDTIIHSWHFNICDESHPF